PGCRTPPLVDLFEYRGPPANADAVRYTARSGARVFSSGTLSFARYLDDFRYHPGDVPLGDPRLEQFVQNLLGDLARPAPVHRLRAVARNGRIEVTAARGRDPRVLEALVYRGAAQEPFRGRLACVMRGARCVDRNPPRGRSL